MEMETATERSNGKLTTWQPQPQPSGILGWLVEQLTILAEAMGETMTPARLKIYASDLADIGQAQLAIAFQHARRQCRFFPKIAELRELAGASPRQNDDAEMRKAWDVLIRFVSKYVSNDVYGSYGPEHGWYSKTFPQLSDRLLATVRRTGGWKVYARMTDEDFPFQQKRFFEEYQAWAAVENLDPGHILTTLSAAIAQRRLAPVMPIKPEAERKPAQVPLVQPKPIPAPPTDAQLRDRREMLRQQAATLLRREEAVSQGQREAQTSA
jgi:hypothetical protein